MSDIGAQQTPAEAKAAAVAAHDDERLAYRGVFQRLFIRPEIGAIIGAIGIWAFFWAVSVSQGTANGTAGVLDTASTLGIMAVAVSILMIGGEFDLSSGANTGAMGIVIILLVKETGDIGGAGLSLFLAIPLSFLVAMAIGWANGWMVEKTALPSFIVTLATFFVLKGGKLGFSKLLVDQIQVGRIDEGHGYSFWYKIFAAEWDRAAHQLASRDTIYLVLVLAGLAIMWAAAHEMHFVHAERANPSGAVVFGIGVAAVIVGIIVLHRTDNVTGNWIGSAVIAVGAVVGLIGLGVWRYEPLYDRGSLSLNTDILVAIGLGIGSMVLAVVFALAFDPSDESNLFFPFTEQGFRATLFGTFSIIGFTLLFMATSRAKRVSPITKTVVSTITAVVLAAMAFFIQSESASVRFRSEAFSAILAIALLLFAWAIVGSLFVERSSVDHMADKLGARILTIGGVVALSGFIIKLAFTTNEELAGGVTPAKFSMRIAWFVAFTAVMVWLLGRTRFGSWTYAVGGNKDAARQVGVPAARTKTQLFMLVSGAAWLVGMLLAFRLNTIQAATGDGLEFQYIIAAVVGGTLLTGGYGTAVGGAIGALIMAMATLGIPNSRWNSDWRFLFIGVILLLAVVANRSIRTRAEALRT